MEFLACRYNCTIDRSFKSTLRLPRISSPEISNFVITWLPQKAPWFTWVRHACFSLISHTHRGQSRALQAVRYQHYRPGHVTIHRYYHCLRAYERLLELCSVHFDFSSFDSYRLYNYPEWNPTSYPWFNETLPNRNYSRAEKMNWYCITFVQSADKICEVTPGYLLRHTFLQLRESRGSGARK